MIIQRRQAREEALQLLYALELNRISLNEVLKDTTIIRPDGSPIDSFTGTLLKKAAETDTECLSLIEKQTHNWDIERITLIDRLILRLAVTEFLYFPDIPPKVTINEALEIARKYSTSDSVGFINGVLDAVLAELTASHRIYKEGRGLESCDRKQKKQVKGDTEKKR